MHQSSHTWHVLRTLSYSVQHDRDLLVFTHSPLQEAYEDAVGHVLPLHFVRLSVHTPERNKHPEFVDYF